MLKFWCFHSLGVLGEEIVKRVQRGMFWVWGRTSDTDVGFKMNPVSSFACFYLLYCLNLGLAILQHICLYLITECVYNWGLALQKPMLVTFFSFIVSFIFFGWLISLLSSTGICFFPFLLFWRGREDIWYTNLIISNVSFPIHLLLGFG